ncbi:alpha-ketoglutarate decarboxylase [Nonlabens xiamenensis]|uniref:alpha-ketoglutarate decarboxylase n=1 Tax=Nonlabens xiamenensis TaxID=2341043 RepID=UPI000F613DF4|nr:alpha-ketoglutarate decarboxylase [Nonlabens xiamenensis]
MKSYSVKNLAIFLIFILFSCFSFSQQDPGSDFWKRVRFGGNLGASFGNNFSSVIVAPQAIYQFNPFFGLGVGLNYSYSEFNPPRNSSLIGSKSNIAGGSLIALGSPVDFLQLSADFEYLNVNRNFDEPAFDDEYWVPALFLGAGYRQGNVIFGARYDVLFDRDRSVYNNGIQPFVRVLF